MGLEPLQGLREAAVPFRLDRADDVLRPGRGRGPDLAHGAVEVPEDAAHLLLKGDEGALPERLDGRPGDLLQGSPRRHMGRH